jgi:UDP-N-acetylmuramoylalanine--D-glutamate ligase
MSMLALKDQLNHRVIKYDSVVVGLGHTGLSCLRYLTRSGQHCAVTDSRSNPPQQEILRHEMPGVYLTAGGFDANLLLSARQLVLSPGVALSEPAVQAALSAGVPVVGDIELFARAAQAPVVAITGTNGKSTVTSLVGEMCVAAGRRTAVGGNLGTPALDLLAQEPGTYVLELSSFQLETTESLNCAAATVLNLSPDHMDRYADMAAYAVAKQGIFRGTGFMVINADDPLVAQMITSRRPLIRFGFGPQADFSLRKLDGRNWLAQHGTPLMPLAELKIAGRHNAANALAALALGTAINLDMDAMLGVLRIFPGLPHRCQWVAGQNDVDWYNDSKGTNIGSTVAAIDGLGATRRLVLILGGDSKGQDFSPLAQAMRGRVRAAVLIGRDAQKIRHAIETTLPGEIALTDAKDLPGAVAQCAELAKPGDAVLLSPACASLDMFENYAHRGRVFTEAVKQELGV